MSETTLKSIRAIKLIKKLSSCTGCELCKYKPRRTSRPIPGVGDVPADILLLGESPNEVDDLMKEPFSGEDGKLLYTLVNEARKAANIKNLTYFTTNSVLCRSWVWDKNEEFYGKNCKPQETFLLSCMPNIISIYKLVNPKLVVYVGKTPEQYYKNEFRFTVTILHPSVHLQFGGKPSPYYRTDYRSLTDAFIRYLK